MGLLHVSRASRVRLLDLPHKETSMKRNSLAFLALAGLTAISGCQSFDSASCDPCGGGRPEMSSFFSRFHRSPSRGEPVNFGCDSCQQGAISNFEGGPGLPGGDFIAPPAPTPSAGVPVAPPPRIIPVPQANPMPYTPQSLVKRPGLLNLRSPRD